MSLFREESDWKCKLGFDLVLSGVGEYKFNWKGCWGRPSIRGHFDVKNGQVWLRSGAGGPDSGADGGCVAICASLGDTTCGCGGNICIAGSTGYGATCFGSRVYIRGGNSSGGGTTRYGCVSLGYGTTQKMYTCNGGICVIGTIGCTSDARIKKNVVPVSNALSMVTCLCGVCFDYCENDEQSIGLIAQDVLPVLPRVVSQGVIPDDQEEEMEKLGIDDGMYGLNYGGFVPVLIEAMKEQQQQIEDLRQEIETLKGN